MPRIRISNIELYVEIRGAGPPLLLVHGFPLDHSMWAGQLDTLSSDFQIIAPDLRGFGRSDATGGTVFMEQFADDLAELLQVMGIDRPIAFCGLSMGGYIAWQFWRRHGERLQSLILCDTRAVADPKDVARGRGIAATQVEVDGPANLSATMIPKLFADRTRQQHPELVEQIKRVMISSAPEGVAAALRGMAARPDMAGELPQINVPTLVICGQQDVISPSQEMRDIAGSMPNAVFVEIANAGHMAPLEQPGAVNSAIREFLQT